MRIWVIISSIVILLFCVPGLLVAAFTTDWGTILTCLVLNALAIHGLYYAKAAVTNPQQGYRHLAVNQLLLGIVCAGLLLGLNAVLGSTEFWDMTYRQLIDTFHQVPGMAASQQEIEAALRQTIEPVRHWMTTLLWAFAALVFLSQVLFAWMLYRRSDAIPH